MAAVIGKTLWLAPSQPEPYQCEKWAAVAITTLAAQEVPEVLLVQGRPVHPAVPLAPAARPVHPAVPLALELLVPL